MRNVREIDKTNSLSKDDFIKRVFDEFGDGETLSRAGFERLILSLQRPIKNNHLEAWIYASVSVVLISLCGVLAVAVIPVMQKAVYHGLLQFLVALAVGTLCGDALLHLLPHAMMSINLWRGFVAALSVAFFYFTEKCLSLITEWKKKNQRKNKMNTIVRVMREDHGTDEESRVGEKLCKHKYSSYPYCYGEITNSTGKFLIDTFYNNFKTVIRIREENGATKAACQDVSFIMIFTKLLSFYDNMNYKGESLERYPIFLQLYVDTNKEEVPNSQVDYTTIILREHETHHHGHAHTHGHVHSAPGSMGNVAWMVIMGDGIHNFTDGLAIGAAFAANIGGGISTAVAVFCHELPHEIGDFAVLLKAGMSARQAVFYNLLSSLLCFIGMALGVVLGHNGDVKMWLFSGAAGMFLYIALVDMIPELTSSHSKEGGSLCQCLLQLFGLMSGIGIMLIIALYEEDLMTSFQHS
uniref:Uncharacterized protein n=1 Tax=Rhodnius prolixus TaxID=13249 RepID=T1HHD1_RHOPR